MSNEKEREVTLEEVAEMRRKKKRHPGWVVPDLKVSGVVTVFDKDGKEKGKMKVTSINDLKEK